MKLKHIYTPTCKLTIGELPGIDKPLYLVTLPPGENGEEIDADERALYIGDDSEKVFRHMSFWEIVEFGDG